jgi:hypothetical protein
MRHARIRPSGLTLDDLAVLNDAAAWLGSCEAQDDEVHTGVAPELTSDEVIDAARDSLHAALRVLTRWRRRLRVREKRGAT